MNVYEFVLAILLIVTIGRVLERRVKHRRDRVLTGEDEQPVSDDADLQKIRALEERVEVLERIVTDQGYETRQKFREIE